MVSSHQQLLLLSLYFPYNHRLHLQAVGPNNPLPQATSVRYFIRVINKKSKGLCYDKPDSVIQRPSMYLCVRNVGVLSFWAR